jgi:hypothetical protein
VGVITIDRDHPALTPVQAYGLDTLLDLARLIPLDAAHPRLPRLRLVEGPTGSLSDPALVSAPPAVASGVVTITTATLGAAGRLAGAVAEQGSTAEDRYARVPSTENPLVREALWQRPILSESAHRLRAAVIAATADPAALRFPVPWPDGRRWAVALTHDLDLVAGWGFATGLRLLELFRHGAPRQALATLRAAAGAIASRPVEGAITRLLDRLAGAGVRGTWFVLCGTPTLGSWRRGDLTYLPESPRVRRLLLQIRAAGHEVGLHGSFETQRSAAALSDQRARLERIVERSVHGVRQHFLRMRPGATQRAMLEAGFRYDATYGFADRSGYRLGTADIVAAWDRSAERVLPLVEAPLHWMDRTLSKYAGDESPDSWVADGLARAAEAQAVEGLWVGLWHPNLSAPLGFPGAEAAFESLLAELGPRRPHFGTVDELVTWRAIRRAAHVVHIRADGSAVFSSAPTLPFEDVDGKPVPVERVAA